MIHRTDPPPYYLVLLDESVLMRNVGGRRVLANQLDMLATLAEQNNVIIRIAPLAESAMALLGNFTLLNLDDGNEILYQEEMTIDEVIHASSQVHRFRAKFEMLWARALEPDVSKRLIVARTAELFSRLERETG